jgi:hypothetical protein
MEETEENQELKCCGRCKVMKQLTEFYIKQNTWLNLLNSLKKGLELKIEVSSWCKRCHSNYANQKEKEKRATTEHKAIMKECKRKRKEERQQLRAGQSPKPKPKPKMTQEERDKLNEYKRDRYKHDVQYRLAQLLRCRVRAAMKVSRATKRGTTWALLGCSLDVLRLHIEAQFKPDMSWNNHGELWHIDHIKPLAAYDLGNPEEQREALHYTNLQPLYACDNVKKNSVFEGMRYRYKRTSQ